ncbi:MAG: hypothetical protein U0235_17100 [Polyangiaceae bacterium]
MMAAAAAQAPMLRVAAVWGTTVLHLRTLRKGESFTLGDGTIAPPDNVELPELPVKGSAQGWEIDPKGTLGGLVRLRGRDEDPVALSQSGTGVPIVPGDYGVLQYGLFSIFFQYTSGAEQAKGRTNFELLLALAVVSSVIFHFGIFGMIGALSTPPAIPKPLELTSPEEFASRFRIKRVEEEPPLPSAGAEDKGSGVKDPGLQDKKPQGGGQKMKGAEGKLGLKGDRDKTELPGEVKPSTNLGGLSEVLESSTGKEIRSTLETIKSVSDALGGLNAKDIVLGGRPGMALEEAAPAAGHGRGRAVRRGQPGRRRPGRRRASAWAQAASAVAAQVATVAAAPAAAMARAAAAPAPAKAKVTVGAGTPATKGRPHPKQCDA